MFPEHYIVIASRQEYDDVMHILDNLGYKWISSRSLLEYDPFDQYFRHKNSMIHIWPDLQVSIAQRSIYEPEERISKTIGYVEFMAEFSVEEEMQIRCMDAII